MIWSFYFFHFIYFLTSNCLLTEVDDIYGQMQACFSCFMGMNTCVQLEPLRNNNDVQREDGGCVLIFIRISMKQL